MDIAATAGGLGKAVDLVFNDIRPQHGVIAIRFQGTVSTIAMIQAIEVGPGLGGAGAKPVAFAFPPDVNRLSNPGFEDSIPGLVGNGGQGYGGTASMPWKFRFLGPGKRISPETAFNVHAEWGPPKPRSGKDAMRTYAIEERCPYAGLPGRPRLAADALSGFRLGAGGRFARQGIRHARRRFGRVVRDRDGCRGQGPRRASQGGRHEGWRFTELSRTFTTTAGTAKVRFLLDTVIGCRASRGTSPTMIARVGPASEIGRRGPAYIASSLSTRSQPNTSPNASEGH